MARAALRRLDRAASLFLYGLALGLHLDFLIQRSAEHIGDHLHNRRSTTP